MGAHPIRTGITSSPPKAFQMWIQLWDSKTLRSFFLTGKSNSLRRWFCFQPIVFVPSAIETWPCPDCRAAYEHRNPVGSAWSSGRARSSARPSSGRRSAIWRRCPQVHVICFPSSRSRASRRRAPPRTGSSSLFEEKREKRVVWINYRFIGRPIERHAVRYPPDSIQ